MARLLFTGKAFGTFDLQNGDKAKRSLQKTLAISNVNYMKQVHGNKIEIISEAANDLPEADGLVTNQRSIALAVQVADCLPLLLQSEVAVAAVHVGRKGLLNGVAVAAVAALKQFGATKISGVVGPHICGNCYEVDKAMFDEITHQHPATKSTGQNLNLFAGLAAQISEIPLINLNICTLENPNYFSFRRGGESGRQVGVICL
jgi:YfiH family protein